MSKMKKLAGGDSPLVVAGWMLAGAAVAVLMALSLPMDALAAAGDAKDGGGGSGATKNFNKKGTGALKDVGVPLFGAVAMSGIVMGVFAKKFALAFGVVLVAAVGLAISLDPESTMKTLGNGIADLFKA